MVQAERRTRSMVVGVRDSVLLLSREASPWSSGGLESRLLQSARRGVYDLDDALFADRQGWRRMLGKEPKCRRSMESADHVIVGNEYLAEYAARYSHDVTVIPTCVEPAAYKHKPTYDLTDRPRLVWLGSPSTERYLLDIAPALREVHRRTGARLTLISVPKEVEHPELDGLTDRAAWNPQSTPELLAAADVALGPLSDDEYSRGKCAYKLLQYAASGLPMVGSPVGANKLALSRFDGLAANTLDDWIDAITSLLHSSPAERRRRGDTAISAVRAHYSFDVWTDAWKGAVGV
ncbi:glycosyltransferase [Nocardioides flavus (ex Wang et al. 2016)]|uniref:glycosyltransferase n=1 Tax=Nocardioides flavus (ex Wang et al. 2016) TaxID=2058780 RepID=UPI00174D9490|nr:glycosyltransferase [Nocardioides flavus (ex Wang et al. 2016)]